MEEMTKDGTSPVLRVLARLLPLTVTDTVKSGVAILCTFSAAACNSSGTDTILMMLWGKRLVRTFDGSGIATFMSVASPLTSRA